MDTHTHTSIIDIIIDTSIIDIRNYLRLFSFPLYWLWFSLSLVFFHTLYVVTHTSIIRPLKCYLYNTFDRKWSNMSLTITHSNGPSACIPEIQEKNHSLFQAFVWILFIWWSRVSNACCLGNKYLTISHPRLYFITRTPRIESNICQVLNIAQHISHSDNHLVLMMRNSPGGI